MDESILCSVRSAHSTYLVCSAATRVLGNDEEESRLREPAMPRQLPLLHAGLSLGPYCLLRLLGQGVQGEVWKAVRRGSEKEVVAIKVLNPLLVSQPNRLAQFRHEAARGALLSGPALLPVREFDESHGLPYMVMPYVRGISLLNVIRARLARRRGEPVNFRHPLIMAKDASYQTLACRLMLTAVLALERLHACRIVHRDVKPANILLDGDTASGIYLCDLGLGRDLEFATAEQMRDGSGTPLYMAPERLLRARANEILCDIYSIGVTLFETITLARPVPVPEQMHANVLHRFLAFAAPRSPREVNPQIPAELEDLIMKAMARKPEDRHQSAADLAEDLKCFLRRRRHVSTPAPAPHIHAGSCYRGA